MESAVSAFAVYKAKTNSNHSKKQLKKQKVKVNKTLPNKPEKLTEHTMKKAAKKLKQKQEKKPKDNIKKKIHKKKKKGKKQQGKNLSNNDKPKNQPNTSNKLVALTKGVPEQLVDDDIEDSVSEDIPILVPAVQINGFSDQISESDGSVVDLPFTPITTSSVSEGLRAFSWMTAPFEAREFFCNVWEKKPLHIKRTKPNYYHDIMSTPWFDKILRTHHIQYEKNIDITTYADGKKENHNLQGRAHPHVVWDYYLNGCSIRLINPQTFTPKLHLLNATLQEFFNCFVGANAYLTPPDSQGFAPHYDDIEAFVLQIEGKKLWKVYKPRSDEETLPRYSSKDFDPTEIGEPILEVILEAGDLLYFPRGYIHQAITIDGEHSLHITVSINQKHSWADLLEMLIPAALQETIKNTLDIRKALPFDIYDNFGQVNSEIKSQRKTELTNAIKGFVDRIKSHLNIEQAVDEMAKLYQHAVLPPVLTDLEKEVTVFGDYDAMVANGKVVNRVEVNLDTRIRLLRKNILRMVVEGEDIKVYYCVENSLEYHGNELQFIIIPENSAPAVETLITAYPEYIFVENLDVANGAEADKLQLASDLWDRGLIMSEFPLEIVEDD